MAVVSATSLAGDPPWADGIGTELSRLGLQVVERERLAAALNEQAMTELLSTGGIGRRVKVGQVVGADALVVLSVTRTADAVRPMLGGVVIDTTTGARLGTFAVPVRANAFEDRSFAAAAEANNILRRFPGGVRSIVCVSDFLCRNLLHDDDRLQSDFATTVRTALGSVPGTAVVEIDEARAIRAELDLAGRDSVNADRPVPAAIEGEFRTVRRPDEAAMAALTVRVKRGDRVMKEVTPPALPLDAVGRFLSQGVPRLLDGNVAPMSADAQFDTLVARAGEFAKLGDWRTSTSLREAALLIRPDAVEQRCDLIREYSRRNQTPIDDGQSVPAGAKQTANDPFWSGVIARSKANWFRSLQHCEYLVRNRKVSREEATRLCEGAIHSITGVRFASADQLGDCETYKKRFVRDVFSRVPALRPATREEMQGMSGALDAYHFCLDAALFRCDGNFYDADDLELIADLLLRRLPEPLEPSYKFNFTLRDWGYQFGRGEGSVDERRQNKFSQAQYETFIDQLLASDRPVTHIHGGYGRLMLDIAARKSDATTLLKEADALVKSAEGSGIDPQRFSYFMMQLRDEASRLRREVNPTAEKTTLVRRPTPTTRRLATTTPTTRRVVRRPAPPPVAPVPRSEVTLTPIRLELQSNLRTEKVLVPGVRWRAPGGWGGLTNYRPAGPKLDLLWTAGGLLFVNERGVAREVLADDKLSIADVIFDGTYIWVLSHYDRGLYVLDTAGKVVAHLDREQGLPPLNQFPAFLLPLGEGRVMAAGTFGQQYRGWLATIELSVDRKSGSVDVFHESTTVPDYSKQDLYRSKDPTLTTRLEFLTEHTTAGPNPKRLAIVGRDRLAPLMVDLETKKVWVYPSKPYVESFPRGEGRAEAYTTINGVFYVAGGGRGIQSYRLPDPAGPFKLERGVGQGWGMGGVRSGVLARDGDWLYIAGEDWRRLNLKTSEEQILISDPRALPDYGSGGDWLIGKSGLYGLVAFHNGQLYQMK